MGSFMALPTEHWIIQFNLNAFVETGTYLGAGIACARSFRRLDEFHSVEMKPEFYDDAVYMFSRDPRVKIWQGDSQEQLPKILSLSSLESRKILFWLDAHLPKFYDYDGPQLPLETELKVIAEMRPRNDDVIIIDDLRIYAEDDYEFGNNQHADNYDFVKEIMGDRYNIAKSLQHTGYLILLPK
jgi:hypothetical protein